MINYHGCEDCRVIWYDAIQDCIFQSGLLEGLFCALAFRPGWFEENPHIDIIGLVDP